MALLLQQQHLPAAAREQGGGGAAGRAAADDQHVGFDRLSPRVRTVAWRALSGVEVVSIMNAPSGRVRSSRMITAAPARSRARSCARRAMPDRGALSRWMFPMSLQTAAERDLAELLVESLNLEGVAPGAIDPGRAAVQRRAGAGFDRRAGTGAGDQQALRLPAALGQRRQPPHLRVAARAVGARRAAQGRLIRFTPAPPAVNAHASPDLRLALALAYPLLAHLAGSQRDEPLSRRSRWPTSR